MAAITANSYVHQQENLSAALNVKVELDLFKIMIYRLPGKAK
jgi:hypothetical protein